MQGMLRIKPFETHRFQDIIKSKSAVKFEGLTLKEMVIIKETPLISTERGRFDSPRENSSKLPLLKKSNSIMGKEMKASKLMNSRSHSQTSLAKFDRSGLRSPTNNKTPDLSTISNFQPKRIFSQKSYKHIFDKSEEPSPRKDSEKGKSNNSNTKDGLSPSNNRNKMIEEHKKMCEISQKLINERMEDNYWFNTISNIPLPKKPTLFKINSERCFNNKKSLQFNNTQSISNKSAEKWNPSSPTSNKTSSSSLNQKIYPVEGGLTLKKTSSFKRKLKTKGQTLSIQYSKQKLQEFLDKRSTKEEAEAIEKAMNEENKLIAKLDECMINNKEDFDNMVSGYRNLDKTSNTSDFREMEETITASILSGNQFLIKPRQPEIIDFVKSDLMLEANLKRKQEKENEKLFKFENEERNTKFFSFVNETDMKLQMAANQSKKMYETSAKDPYKYTESNAFFGFVKVGDLVKVVRCLLKNPELANDRDSIQATPLYWASKRGHISVVEVLLHYGANLYASDIFGRTPLKVAVENNSDDILSLFDEVKRGAFIKNTERDNITIFLSGLRTLNRQKLMECIS